MRYFIFFTILLLPKLLFAGEFFMESSEETPGVGSSFVVDVFVGTTEAANVLSGTINFDNEVFSLKRINTGNSIVSFWIEKPSERQDGAITYSGIVAGGFNLTQAKIFSIELIPKIATESKLFITNPVLLAHDGKGTALSTETESLVLATKSVQVIDEVLERDIEPPESFTPVVVKRDDWFDGKSVLVFDAKDKDTGVDAYYLKEVAYSWLAPFSSWRLVTSPYELKDQSQRSFVYLKAEDKAGNSRLVVLEPESKRPIYPFYLALGLILVIIILIRKRRSEAHN